MPILGRQHGWPSMRSQMAKLIGAMGESEFEEELLVTLNKLFRIDLYAVFPFDRADRLLGIMTASRPTTELARDLACRFCNNQSRTNVAIMGGRNASLIGGAQHWRMRWNEVPSEEIKQEFFCRVGIVEKMSTRLSSSSGTIIWSVYRRNEFFSNDEFEIFREMSEVISAALAKHLRFADLAFPIVCNGQTARSNLLSSLEHRAPRLSGREWEVCEGIARGKTTNIIAGELGIKLSSVLTYKKRIYGKLGVSTQRELMAIMLRDATSSRARSEAVGRELARH